MRLLAGLLGACLAASSAATFDVASVKPSSPVATAVPGRKGVSPFSTGPTRLTARRLTLQSLISRAYGVDVSQVSGGPGWIDSDEYDIDAAVEAPASREQMLVMLQALLADRFRLTLHRETRQVARYVLVVAKNGPKFGPHFHAAEGGPLPPNYRPTAQDGLKQYTMARLAFFLSDNREYWDPDAGGGANPKPLPVVDQTGLTGTYDIVLDWTSRRDWLASFERDTGLKLELRKSSSELVVVDSAARPTPN